MLTSTRIASWARLEAASMKTATLTSCPRRLLVRQQQLRQPRIFPPPPPPHHDGHGKLSRRTLMSSSRAAPEPRMPDSAQKLQYTARDFPEEPVTLGWTSRAIYLQCEPLRHRVRALAPMTLRDSCACVLCRDAVSGNKTYRSTEIPDELEIAHVEPTEAGLEVLFAHDIPRLSQGGADRTHQTTVPWDVLEVVLGRRGAREPAASGGPLFPRKRAIEMHTGVQYWDAAVLAENVRGIEFDEYMQDGPAFWDAVIDICRLGIVFLTKVPRDERSVVAIAQRMANIRETFYGRTFDVRAKPDADNVAYTSHALNLHQDLLYLNPPPLIQVLHCMDNDDSSIVGGDSLFSDGSRAAHLLWPFVRVSERLAPLTRRRVPYHYARNGFHYHAERAVLRGPSRERVDFRARDADVVALPELFWSPPFQAPHSDDPAHDLRPWVEAARFLEGVFSREGAVHRCRLRAGDCVIFDNMRVLHGREAFYPASSSSSSTTNTNNNITDSRDMHGAIGNGGGDDNSGESGAGGSGAGAGAGRWLRGAYISAEDFLSRAAHMPLAQAHALRGIGTGTGTASEPWTPHAARQYLLRTPWHDVLREEVCDFDPPVAREWVR